MRPNNCKICGHSDTEFLYRVESKRYAPGEYFDLHRCSHCSGIFINPFLEHSDIQKYYPIGYEPHDPNRTQPSKARDLVTKHLRKYIYGHRTSRESIQSNMVGKLLAGMFDLLTYRSFPWPQDERKLLDIGCGNGTCTSGARFRR